jgi:hypothetical protein
MDGKQNVDPHNRRAPHCDLLSKKLWRRRFVTTHYNAISPKGCVMNNTKYHLLLVSLLAIWTGLATSSCSKTADQSAQQRDSITNLLDAYVNGYETGDWGKVRFAADVTFEGPLKGPIRGESAVRTFLSSVRTKDVRVKRQIIDGEFACVLADFETTEGTVVPFCEFFRIKDGQIAEIRPYFDPRPLIR